MNSRFLIRTAFLLLFSAGLARGAGRDPAYGQKVVSLSFSGDIRVEERALARLVEIEPGEVLTEDRVRASLRNLFATGRFVDLRVDVAETGDGVIAVIHFIAASRVEKVEISGSHLPSRGRLRDAAGVFAGDFWVPENTETAERHIMAALRERGYLGSQVRTVVEAGEREPNLVVRFEIDPGRRAVAGGGEFVGAIDPFSPGELQKAGKVRPGRVYKPIVAREDADRFTAFLKAGGYLEADVRFERVRYDPETGRAFPVYHVNRGPLETIKVSGMSGDAVKEHPQAPWNRLEPLDDESLGRFSEALRKDFQEKGYARAEVNAAVRAVDGGSEVTIEAKKGERHAINSVSFSGNQAIPVKTLESLIETKPRGFLTAGRLVSQLLETDALAIQAAYNRRGYQEARVAVPAVTDARPPFMLDVTFFVEEGRPVLVRKRRVKGADAVAEVAVSLGAAVLEGAPFNMAPVDSAVALARSQYLEKGYLDARVEAHVTRGEEDGKPFADIEFEISEGEKTLFGKTIVRGPRKTRIKLIENEIDYSEGDPFSLSRLFKTHQNLARFGIFERIEYSTFERDVDSGRRAVVLTVTEGKPWNLIYGIGAEYNGQASQNPLTPRLSLGLTHNNILGRALVATIEGRYSLNDKRVLGRIKDPSVFDLRIPVSLVVFWSNEFRSSTELRRWGTFLEAERRLSALLKATARFQYEIVLPERDDPELEKQDRETKTASAGGGLTLDRRDDAIEPTRGEFISGDVEYAFPMLAADSRYFKIFGQLSALRRVKSSVLAVSFRFGGIRNRKPCDLQSNPRCQPNFEIPVVERFFAGGRSTHRAFPLDNLGVPGETLINGDGVGGNALLLGNLELRIPLVSDLGVVVFSDAGNVYESPSKIRLSQIRYGAGLGLFYKTPIGPLRLEYGVKLDKQAGEDLGVLNFTVGHPF